MNQPWIYMGEGEGGMFPENSIETCVLSRVKQITSPGWMHVCLLWRNVCLVLWPTFWLGCSIFWPWAAWAACIFWRLIVCTLFSFAIIFSHSEGCLFTLFVVSFAVQKFLSLIRPHLFICLFLFLFPLLWEVGARGSCCDLCRRLFCLCFPLRVL